MIRSAMLTVQPAVFDWESHRAEIEDTATLLGAYLAEVGTRGRTAGSKHRELGAVGKALQRARTLRGEALLGYARRVHEQTTGNRFPAGAPEKLDQGLRKLDQLLQKAPRNVIGMLLDRVGYSTYYDVKRRFVEFQRAWLRYLDENAIRLGFKLDPEKPVWFSKKLEQQGAVWKQVMEDFLRTRRESIAIEAEEDEL